MKLKQSKLVVLILAGIVLLMAGHENRTIPVDEVPPSGKFSELIAAFKLLARAPVMARTQGKVMSPGILPAGENGVLIVIRRDGREIRGKWQSLLWNRMERSDWQELKLGQETGEPNSIISTMLRRWAA